MPVKTLSPARVLDPSWLLGESDGAGPPATENHPTTGGVYDDHHSGGQVTIPIRSGRVTFSAKGGVVTTPIRGGRVVMKARSGIFDQAATGGTHDNAATGGEVL